jgi:hypothetical protein
MILYFVLTSSPSHKLLGVRSSATTNLEYKEIWFLTACCFLIFDLRSLFVHTLIPLEYE